MQSSLRKKNSSTPVTGDRVPSNKKPHITSKRTVFGWKLILSKYVQKLCTQWRCGLRLEMSIFIIDFNRLPSPLTFAARQTAPNRNGHKWSSSERVAVHAIETGDLQEMDHVKPRSMALKCSWKWWINNDAVAESPRRAPLAHIN